MAFEVWTQATDIYGKERNYLLAPDLAPNPAVLAQFTPDEIKDNSLLVDIPDTATFDDRMVSELDLIHMLETNEAKLEKCARKIIDMSLDYPGTLATSVAAGLVMYNSTQSVWGTVGVAIGGFVGHEILRRPVVGARHIYHQVKNPWTPAAQSTARIRRDILDT